MDLERQAARPTEDEYQRAMACAAEALRAYPPTERVQPMTATTATTPSALLRRPPPPTARRTAPEPRIVVTGELLEDAYSCGEPATGRAGFVVTIAQRAGQPPIVATRWVGDGPDAAQYANARARALRTGDVVSAHGGGLHLRFRHDAPALVLDHVRDIELEEAAAP